MNEEFFLRELGGVARLVNKVTYYSLDENGEWIHNQRAISMFVDDPCEYIRLSEDETKAIIDAIKCTKARESRTKHDRLEPSLKTIKHLTALCKRVFMPKARERLDALLNAIRYECYNLLFENRLF